MQNRKLKRQRDVHNVLPKAPDGDIVRIRTEHHGVGKLKAILIILVALLQLCVLALFYLELISVFSWYLVLSVVLDLLTCLYVLSSGKNGRSKAVWILIILVFFPVGFLLYFLSDEKIFFAASRRRYKKIHSASAEYVCHGCGDDCVGANMRTVCGYLKNAGDFVPYKNTRPVYFSSGAQAFDDMIVSCAEAQKFIFIEYFIVAEGILFARLFSVLEERAAAGVDVRIIYDDVGSAGRIPRKLKKMVRAAGIKMYAFNKLVPMYKIGMNYRDHRKITVIDGVTAYTGGINIADEYINEKRMYGYWKDNAVRLDGDAAEGFTLMFLRQWEFVTKKTVDYSVFMRGGQSAAQDSAEGGVFVPYASGLEYSQPIARDIYAGIISEARERLWIMTPYLVPDETITNLLCAKALSGVDVRVVLPGVPDKRFVYLISLDNADRLLRSGVKVYTMPDAFVHTKSVLTENCAVIGSVNFDLRSFFQQYENALCTDDATITGGLKADFENTFPDCIQRRYVKEKPKFTHRLLTALLQLFAPMM